MDRRNELAAAAAAAFAEEHNAGGSGEEQAGPGPEGFTEGAAEGESVQGEALPPALAPALCWQPAQLAADLALAKQLMQAADKEKSISSNPLQPTAPAAAASEAAAPAGEGGDEQPAAEQEQAEPESAVAVDPDAELSPEEQATKLDQVGMLVGWQCSSSNFPASNVSQPASCLPGSWGSVVLWHLPPTCGSLIRCPFCLQVLVYLWRVHGIDYYGGREYTNPAEPGRAAARRTQRGPKPSEADMAAAAAAAAETEAGGAAVEDGAEPAAAVADDSVKPEGEAAAEGTAAEAAAEVGEAAAADGDEAAGDAAAAEAKSPTAAAAAAVAAAATSPKAAGSAGKQQLQLGGAGEEGCEYEQRVVGFWRFRLEKGDPLEMPLHRQQVRLRLQLPAGSPSRRCCCWRRLAAAVCLWVPPPFARRHTPSLPTPPCSQIEADVEKFLESQIIKIEDNKWGNKLSTVGGPAGLAQTPSSLCVLVRVSRGDMAWGLHCCTTVPLILSPRSSPPAPAYSPQKMFMGRDFVVKHLRNKHGHVLQAERERLQEEAYWQNFRWARTASWGWGRGAATMAGLLCMCSG